MLTVLGCFIGEHDLWLVALVAFIVLLFFVPITRHEKSVTLDYSAFLKDVSAKQGWREKS